MINYNNENGRSMIEMLGVLAIIGVLSVGGIAGYTKAMMKYRINKTIEQITLIAGNVRTFFANQKTISLRFNKDGPQDEASEKIVRKARLVPEEMMYLNGDGEIVYLVSTFGERFFVIGSPSSKFFSLYFYNLPQEACIELLSHDWNNANASAISVNGGEYLTFFLPVNVDDAVKACDYINRSLESNGDYNVSILFDYTGDMTDAVNETKEILSKL